MREKYNLSRVDIRILRILQDDASLPIAEIAKMANMSQSPCWRRVRSLKQSGIIRQIVAIVDREKIGLEFVAYAFVKLALPNRENMEKFDEMVLSWPEITTCERITGTVDYLIKVYASDIKSYDNFLRLKLLDNNLVSDVQSRIVVNTVKDISQIPLDSI